MVELQSDIGSQKTSVVLRTPMVKAVHLVVLYLDGQSYGVSDRTFWGIRYFAGLFQVYIVQVQVGYVSSESTYALGEVTV